MLGFFFSARNSRLNYTFHMSVIFTIANVGHALMALKEKISPDKWGDTPLPVIAAPGWFIDAVGKELGAEPGLVVDSIHGCSVLRQDELNEPVLIDHDGKAFPILPAWMRAKKSAETEPKT